MVLVSLGEVEGCSGISDLSLWRCGSGQRHSAWGEVSFVRLGSPGWTLVLP